MMRLTANRRIYRILQTVILISNILSKTITLKDTLDFFFNIGKSNFIAVATSYSL